MKELYEKVAADSALKAKFAEIMKNAEAAGEEATKKKLTAFAKETGYDVTVEEMQTFFKALAESKEGELSDVELESGRRGEEFGRVRIINNHPWTWLRSCINNRRGRL